MARRASGNGRSSSLAMFLNFDELGTKTVPKRTAA
jgi:hypothetical protein